MPYLDAYDVQLIELLQDDGRMPNAELARRIGMAPSAVLERVRKLEERQLIKGYEAHMDPKQLGLSLTAFIFVRISGRSVGPDLVALPNVQEVHEVAGEDCYLIKARVRDTDDLGRLLREEIATIPNVVGTRTTIVLTTWKETSKLPVPEATK